MDEFMKVFAVQTQSQAAAAFVMLSEVRLTRVLVYLTIGLFALVNNWPVVGVPAFVLAAVAGYMALSAHRKAQDLARHSQALRQR